MRRRAPAAPSPATVDPEAWAFPCSGPAVDTQAEVDFLALSPCGSLLYTVGGEHGCVASWDTSVPWRPRRLGRCERGAADGTGSGVAAAVLGPCGRRLYTAGRDGEARACPGARPRERAG